jgi:hypothetical protein
MGMPLQAEASQQVDEQPSHTNITELASAATALQSDRSTSPGAKPTPQSLSPLYERRACGMVTGVGSAICDSTRR